MKKSLLITGVLTALILCPALLRAQAADNIIKSLEADRPSEGRVRIYQDPQVAALIGATRSEIHSGTGQPVKLPGYRVQVYAGPSTRESNTEADRMAAQVKEYFPDLKVHKYFNSPRWVCQVGDYRTFEEADAVMRQLKGAGVFKEATIVRNEITVYY